jgi:catechol 2,3-dioxygenase-like lactoylglutathione lyase family enzyme
MLVALDHVNVRTSRVEELAAFYVELLGLVRGPRPPFSFAGAWLYCGDQPVVHLVDAGTRPPAAQEPDELRLSHFAFRGTNLADFLARLGRAGVQFRLGQLPAAGVTQVNLRDPDGNALHVDFIATPSTWP